MRVTRYDQSFREGALALLERSERTLPQVAQGLGIPPVTLRYWYNREMGNKGRKARARLAPKLPVTDPEHETLEAKVDRLERENAQLRREVDELKTDREILKKAAAFFVKESE
jgi:transposase